MNQKIDQEVPLRISLREAVLKRIMNGQLPAGLRIKETPLAKVLHVSRTPLREALLHLEREGFVVSDLDRGFSVASLSIKEVQEIYPILWTLEGLAVALTGEMISLLIAPLKKINKEFSKERSPGALRKLDSAWHETLISRCNNQQLCESISGLRLRIGRYENVYMQDPGLVKISFEQHAEIISALENGKISEAKSHIERHWNFGMEALLHKVAV